MHRFLLCWLFWTAVAHAAAVQCYVDVERALEPGVNGEACVASPYNCKLRSASGQRVETTSGEQGWEVRGGLDVVDGLGRAMSRGRDRPLRFNHGQVRRINGEPHALAVSTSNGSAGWYPVRGILDPGFLAAAGEVAARGEALAPLTCHRVLADHDPAFGALKVVYDSTSEYERAADYLPRARRNGRSSVNLVFNVPGCAIGGPAIDHFPAGTLFRRLDVPTNPASPRSRWRSGPNRTAASCDPPER